MAPSASALANPLRSGTSPVVAFLRSGTNPGKLARYKARVAWMIRDGVTWTYYPGEDLFEEKVSIQPAKHSPTGKPRFMPSLTVYGREVYEMSEAHWNLFVEYHPHAVACYSAEFRKPSPNGGLLDLDAFAVDREGRIGGGPGGASR